MVSQEAAATSPSPRQRRFPVSCAVSTSGMVRHQRAPGRRFPGRVSRLRRGRGWLPGGRRCWALPWRADRGRRWPSSSCWAPVRWSPPCCTPYTGRRPRSPKSSRSVREPAWSHRPLAGSRIGDPQGPRGRTAERGPRPPAAARLPDPVAPKPLELASMSLDVIDLL